jgi:DNA-binding response OmpR family regulator
MQEPRQTTDPLAITGSTPVQKKALSELFALCPQQNFTVVCTATDITLSGTKTEILKTPVRLSLLLKSIAAVQAIPQDQVKAILINNSTLAPLSRTLTFPDLPPLELTEKECAVLWALQQAFPAAVTREILLAGVWQYHASTTTHTVETHVYRLRQKLENHGVTDFWIVTETEGYKIVYKI